MCERINDGQAKRAGDTLNDIVVSSPDPDPALIESFHGEAQVSVRHRASWVELLRVHY
jgi:hypothetical protein